MKSNEILGFDFVPLEQTVIDNAVQISEVWNLEYWGADESKFGWVNKNKSWNFKL